jgi:hypothetical protein
LETPTARLMQVGGFFVSRAPGVELSDDERHEKKTDFDETH